MVTRSEAPCWSSASISWIGTPHRPKPPTARVAPEGMSATASRVVATTLSMLLPSEGGGGCSVSPARVEPRSWVHHWTEAGSGQPAGEPHLHATVTGRIPGDVHVVAELPGQPQPHAAAGQIVAVRRAVAGERVVPAGAAVPDGADDALLGVPQPEAHRRPSVADGVRRHLVHGQEEVLGRL